MSYILDALRRSERERQQAEPLVLDPIGSEATALPRRRLAPVTGVAVLLIGAIALSAFWIFVAGRSGVTTPVSVSSKPSAVSTPSAAATALATRVAAKEIRPAPELKLSPFAAGRRRSSARDLAQEARIEPSSPPPAPSRTSASPQEAKGVAPAVSDAMASAADASIKFLRAMPPEFQRALPKLAVTIHIYAPREADRILYINNRQYHAGDHIRGDIVVREIVQDGVILSYHGQLFKLPRPT